MQKDTTELKKLTVLQKIKRHFQIWDVFWSFPLAFGLFWFAGFVLTAVFGYATGTYDLGFIQPFFIAWAIVVGAVAAGLGFMWFYARDLFHWFYGKKKDDGTVYEGAKEVWEHLAPAHKFILFFFVLFAPAVLIIFVYIHFI
jgi:hypothetical protein